MAQAHEAAADGPVFDLEGGDEVVRRNKGFGHGATLCERRTGVLVLPSSSFTRSSRLQTVG